MGKIRAALIGLGRVGSLLEEDALREKPCTHAGAIAANPDCELVAGADMDEERRNLFARRWGCPVYGDPEEMIRIHRPEILHIATHPDSHGTYCFLAAKMGVPVAVTEKPLVKTLREARKLEALEKSGAIRIILNHERRYSRDYREAREIMMAEPFGALLNARGTLYMGKRRQLLDTLWEDGTHLIDGMMFLTRSRMLHRKRWGDPLEGSEGTSYLGGSLSGERGEVPFLIEVGAGRDHLVFEMEFSFERGRLRIGNGIFEVWESLPSPYAEKFRSLKRIREGFQGETGYFANMVADAAACARDPARQSQSKAADGLLVIEYLHAVGLTSGRRN